MLNKKDKKEQKKSVRPPHDVLLPEEVTLLREYNEAQPERYARWIRRKRITDELLGKRTLVVGVHGQDGIVLAADTKVIRGGETDYEHKVRKFEIGPKSPIIFASAGAVGVIEDFVEMFEKTLNENIAAGKINSLLSVKIIAENLVETTEERYGPKLQEPSLHFVLGGLSNLSKGKAVLYEIGFPGYGQKTKYNVFVGHGGPYARTIGKYLFPRDNRAGAIPLKCTDLVNRVAFCIRWVGDDVDSYVGCDAQIMYLRDEDPTVHDGVCDKRKVERLVKAMQQGLTSLSFGPRKK
jgi:hypothetical protein